MSNYPDDIRRYDNDPRSPFYKGANISKIKCLECKEVFESDEDSENPMHWVSPMYHDEGLCNECAKNDEIRIEWMGK